MEWRDFKKRNGDGAVRLVVEGGLGVGDMLVQYGDAGVECGESGPQDKWRKSHFSENPLF